MTADQAAKLEIRQLTYRETANGPKLPDPDGWVLHVPGGDWDLSRARGIYRTEADAAEALAAVLADPKVRL